MDDQWPILNSDYLSGICLAFRARSKSIRYLGEFVCEGGVSIDNQFVSTNECLKVDGQKYYLNGINANQNDMEEGIRFYFDSGGIPPCPTMDLIIWRNLAYFEMARATKKNFQQSLLYIDNLRTVFNPKELVEVFKWTIGEAALLQGDFTSKRDIEILKNIELRWRALT